jgi:excinuclease ABC subunit C
MTSEPTAERIEGVLTHKAAAAPAAPGVYLMKDADGRVIYVGKARHLKKRLAAYFTGARHAEGKVDSLVKRIVDFETTITRTEKEALILESNLIKRYRPRYNVMLKDDKRYPSLRLDPKEDYPAFAIVRKIGEDDALYFGPFASAHAVRETLKVITKTFKLRKCKASEFRVRTRPCLHCQMNGCLAPCCRDVAPEVYLEQVREAILFLKGRTPELIRKIRCEMEQASAALEFEKAARMRDKLFALERTVEKQIAVTTDFLDRDVFAAAAAGGAAVITLFTVRGGFLTGTRHFTFLETMAGEEEMLGVFIREFYETETEVPGEIFVSHALEDGALIEEWLAGRRGQRVRLARPKRGEKARLVDMALSNARKELRDLSSARSADREILQRLQQRLGLAQLPERIECFDNSTLMGAEPVASMVVFLGGRAEKAAYRKYRVHRAGASDDYAAMHEILSRRFGNADGAAPLPNLLMVDGGRGQLGVALTVIQELRLGAAFDLLAIAKKDERRGEREDKVFLPGRVNPVNFGKEGDLLLFLQRIRDEAHRFAIAYHRRRRRQASLKSALDEIPGIGPQRKADLVAHFGSMERIRSASVEEIARLPGFSRRLAQAVRDFF